MKKYFLLFIVFVFSLDTFFAETIEFSAGYMTGQTGKSNSTTVLEEDAYIKTSSMEIYADKVELSGKDFRYITASGNVSGKNIESAMDFRCDNLEYDRETKKAVLKGGVVFIDSENNVDAESEIIEYNEQEQIAIFQINVNITQEDNICTGSYCVYYKERQLLEISGNAQVMQKGDKFRAQHITLNIETQEISLDGNVKGAVKSDGAKSGSSDNTDVPDNDNNYGGAQTSITDNNQTDLNKENKDNDIPDDYAVPEKNYTDQTPDDYAFNEPAREEAISNTENSVKTDNYVNNDNDIIITEKEEQTYKDTDIFKKDSQSSDTVLSDFNGNRPDYNNDVFVIDNPLFIKDDNDSKKNDKSKNTEEHEKEESYPEVKATRKKATRRKKPKHSSNVIINDNSNKNNLNKFIEGE